MKVRLNYSPSQRQLMFLHAAEKEQLYGGAKRGGKSVAISMKAILLSVMYPGNRGGLFRQDLTDLRDSLLVTFFQVCPSELIIDHHQTHKQILIDTGSKPSVILYGGLGDIHDVESAKGKEFGWFAIDEPSEIDPEAYRMLLAQLCWKLPDGSFPPYMAMLGSNPEPGWVEEKYRALIEQTSDTRPTATTGRTIFIRALPRDNPGLPPNWETDLRVDAPDAWKKKYRDGSWEVSEGQVYKEFDKAIHIVDCPPPAFLSTLKLVASIDHATTGVTCMAIDGIDPDGNVFALSSYYQRNRLISEHARDMIALANKWVDKCGRRAIVESKKGTDRQMNDVFHAFEYVLIDPSTQSKTQVKQNEITSIQDEYRRLGVPTQLAWNALEAGVNLMSEYIHIKPSHIHPLTNVRGSPSFFIVRGENDDGVREAIGWRKTISDNGTPKYVGADHWLDNQRYIVMSRPEPPRITTGDLRATGDPTADSINRVAMRDMMSFDRKFKTPGTESGQWFPSSGPSKNTGSWF